MSKFSNKALICVDLIAIVEEVTGTSLQCEW